MQNTLSSMILQPIQQKNILQSHTEQNNYVLTVPDTPTNFFKYTTS